ncbi:glutamate receptor 1-like protein, partial [Dinothrombium tinctorium]
CAQLEKGIFALVSPVAGASYETIVSYSNTFQMPFVHPSYSHRSRLRNQSFGLSLKPRYLPAVLEVIKHYKWESVIYLYDNEEGLIKLQNLFSLLHDETFTFQLRAVKHIRSGEEGYLFLRDLEQSDKDSKKYVILECEADVARELITSHVRNIYIERRNFHFFLISLIMDDFWGAKISEFGAVNVTGFRILNRGSAVYRSFMNQWSKLNSSSWPGAGKRQMSVNAALTFDGTMVILKTFERMLRRNPAVFRKNFRRGEVYNNNNTRGIDCKDEVKYWEHGNTIINYLKGTEIEGLTGKLVFDSEGNRKNFSIEVVQTTVNSEAARIAEWSNYTGLKLVPPHYRRIQQNTTDYENKTYIVTSI